jgi:hypothetical protein
MPRASPAAARAGPPPSPPVQNVRHSPAHRQGVNLTISMDKIMNFLSQFQEDGSIPEMADLSVVDEDTDELSEPENEVDGVAEGKNFEIKAKRITPILNRIDTFKYTEDDLCEIDDYANPLKYKNAEFFKQQIVFAFYKMVQKYARFNPKTLTFEEVKTHLHYLLNKKDKSGSSYIFTKCSVNDSK